MTRVVITQSNYLPWKGYFDLIAAADHVVIYDSAQFTKGDWRNRNQIKTASGNKWITVPVKTQGRLGQAINAVQISNPNWAKRHIGQLSASYGDMPYYNEIMAMISSTLLSGQTYLTPLNVELIRVICDFLDINTPISFSENYQHEGSASEKVLQICEALKATTYISGPAAKSYLDTTLFEKASIKVEWFDYNGYPEYEQKWGAFDHYVSILDLLFHFGPNAAQYMKTASS